MAQDYTEYLAGAVLNEQQLVSYRTLSRALKVHCNLAKQMLYEFHRKQNAKKPGVVHATYLITGIQRVEGATTNGVHSQDDEDTVMQSSPALPSSSAAKSDDAPHESILQRSILVVKEEHLEQAKNTFDSISSIHIYSLEASGLSDIQALTECNRNVRVSYASEDPLETWKQYGTVHNAKAQRRTGRTAPPPPAPVVKNAEAKTKPFATTAKAKEAEMKAETKESSHPPVAAAEKKDFPKPVQVKRQNSDIFKSFAKAKTTPKGESQSSAEASPAPQPEDDLMTGFSDDDMDDDVPDQPPEESKEPAGKSKKEREAELQAMMDQEDEPMDDAATPADESREPDAPIDKPPDPKAAEPTETVTVENGRRRGKRRIMKKKTVKDDDGYLVTKEEAAWESFSEDEPEPKKAKMLPSASSANKATTKKGGKPGQGNIMSFFKK